jgi:hydroxymethylbilane synthase
MSEAPLRIGTRGSQLALWQTRRVIAMLQSAGIDAEEQVIRTTGDRRTDVPLAEIGGKGLFLKEIEESLLRGEIDLAVHSLKDVPSLLAPEFRLLAFLPREDPRDAWISHSGERLGKIPGGAAVGTSSPRRRAQILSLRPDLDVRPLRGNVPTRLNAARSGTLDAVVLASAGLIRLGLDDAITERVATEQMVPSAGQGIVVVETLTENEAIEPLRGVLNDDEAELAARCERGLLQEFETLLDCHSPIGAHCTIEHDRLVLDVFVSSPDASRIIRTRHEGDHSHARELIERTAAHLRSEGAEDLLRGQVHSS